MTHKFKSLLATALEHPLRSWGPDAPNLIHAAITIAGDGGTAPLIALEALNEAKRLMSIELDGFTAEQMRNTHVMRWPTRARDAIEAWSIASNNVRHNEFVRRQVP